VGAKKGTRPNSIVQYAASDIVDFVGGQLTHFVANDSAEVVVHRFSPND
jgi:hypothetical protein